MRSPVVDEATADVSPEVIRVVTRPPSRQEVLEKVRSGELEAHPSRATLTRAQVSSQICNIQRDLNLATGLGGDWNQQAWQKLTTWLAQAKKGTCYDNMALLALPARMPVPTLPARENWPALPAPVEQPLAADFHEASAPPQADGEDRVTAPADSEDLVPENPGQPISSSSGSSTEGSSAGSSSESLSEREDENSADNDNDKNEDPGAPEKDMPVPMSLESQISALEDEMHSTDEALLMEQKENATLRDKVKALEKENAKLERKFGML